MLKSCLCNDSSPYLLVSGTITITGAEADDAAKRIDERNKGVIFKNSAPFTDCISKINNTQIDNAKDLDVAMPMYNLIEYSNNCSKNHTVYGNITEMNQVILSQSLNYLNLS